MRHERDEIDDRRLRPHLRDRAIAAPVSRTERDEMIRRLNAGLLVPGPGYAPADHRHPTR